MVLRAKGLRIWHRRMLQPVLVLDTPDYPLTDFKLLDYPQLRSVRALFGGGVLANSEYRDCRADHGIDADEGRAVSLEPTSEISGNLPGGFCFDCLGLGAEELRGEGCER